MNKKEFLLILIASFIATFLRLLINNNILISVIGSFLFGFVIAKKLNKNKNRILLTGFCSSFTSFSGFIYFLYKLINHQNLINIFFFLNMIVILNLLMLSFGYWISSKFT